MFRLGPFELSHPVARGGMGVVWFGRQVEQDLPVAVKVLTERRAKGAQYSEYFRNEVRAVAGLDHPHIVTLLDYGTVGPRTARASEGRVAERCPYLVMEWASRGTLASRRNVETWRELYVVLRQLLDALAHAHARGVIHRDLKPGNVLVCGPGDLRPGLKLADFGIAALHEPDDQVAGTASYMAPEQAAGHWAEQGPWTDLYALGCLGFALVMGAPPFRARNALDVLCRTSSALPSLPRELALPPGFERWLTRLVHPSPLRRYRCAADAAWALAEIDAVAEQYGIVAAGDGPELPDTEVLDADALPTLMWDRPRTGNTGSSSARAALLPTAELETGNVSASSTGEPPRFEPSRPLGRISAAERPPLPDSWRSPRVAHAPAGMIRAGLALWGLRSIPLVDRDVERDALWAALARVDAKSSPQAVVLRGAPGCGKTRLAEWLAERALEVGAVNVLKAVHSPAGGASDGLGPMLARYLRLLGLSGDTLLSRLRNVLGTLGFERGDDVEAIAELVAPSVVFAERPRAASERHALVTRVVRAIAHERPVLVWLDDAQWGPDAVSWARAALASDALAGAPVLFVVTLRDDAGLGALEAGLGGAEQVSELAVHPLAPADGIALVRELLAVERDIAEQVERRVGGNPLFAVQLVGDWVQRGLFEVGAGGFRLRSDAALDLPDDVHAFWTSRVDRLLAERPPSDARTLEIAAMLGQEVHHDEWLGACAILGLAPTPSLLETLLAERLARAGAAGVALSWSFVHGLLVESLERRARDAGRHAENHRACARMLENVGGAPERLAHHMIEAGESQSAVDLIEDAANRRLEQGDLAAVERLLELFARALSELGADADDRRHGTAYVLAAELAFRQGRYDDGDRSAAKAERLGRKQGDEALLGRALCARGRLATARGEFALSMRFYAPAEELASAIGDARLQADIERGMARSLIDTGAQNESFDRYARARDYSLAVGDQQGAGVSCLGLSEVAKQRGELEPAMRWLVTAREHFEACGSRWGLANVAMALGEVHRIVGDLDRAEREYLDAGERFEAIGAGQAAFAGINRALVALAREDWPAARTLLDRGLEIMRRRRRRSFEGALLLPLAVCAEAERRSAESDRLLLAAVAILTETGFVDVDTARSAVLLGDLSEKNGRLGTARRAYELALEQYEKLTRPRETARLREKLETL